MIDPYTPVWQLTIGELKAELMEELQKQLISFLPKNKYEYGIKGLAKILGCSRNTASKIKKSGILDEAIFQNGKILIIDREKALELELIDKNKVS